MTDPVTVLGIAGAAGYVSKDLINKILGPTADYIGGGLKNLVEKQYNNLRNIFEIAARKLGKRIEEPGQVPARVLKHVWDEGRFCEDELMAEYYGGLLASSRTEAGDDDRVIPCLSVLKSMSAHQIRMHYFFYSVVKQLFDGKTLNVSLAKDRLKMKFLSRKMLQ